MSYTHTDLDRIDQAIASQQLEVQLDGRRLRYRDMSELLLARQHIATQLGAANGGGATRRYTFTTLRGD